MTTRRKHTGIPDIISFTEISVPLLQSKTVIKTNACNLAVATCSKHLSPRFSLADVELAQECLALKLFSRYCSRSVWSNLNEFVPISRHSGKPQNSWNFTPLHSTAGEWEGGSCVCCAETTGLLHVFWLWSLSLLDRRVEVKKDWIGTVCESARSAKFHASWMNWCENCSNGEPLMVLRSSSYSSHAPYAASLLAFTSSEKYQFSEQNLASSSLP